MWKKLRIRINSGIMVTLICNNPSGKNRRFLPPPLAQGRLWLILWQPPKSKPNEVGSIWRGRTREQSAVFAARRKRNGASLKEAPVKPNRSQTKWVRFGKEEGDNGYGAFANSGSGMKSVSSDDGGPIR